MARSLKSQQKVVIITGCSSGLGLAIAKCLYHTTSYRLVITTRGPSLKVIQDLFPNGDRSMVRELDVTISGQIHTLLNEVCNHWGRIDVLVNNAGVCFRSVVEHMDEAAEELQLRTNYLGPMMMIKSVLPLMREQRSGHIINVSSVSGMLSMPTMASYSASKHALEGASEALWYEARPYGILVTLVQPGFINSRSFQNVILPNKARMSATVQGPHSEFYDSMGPFIEWLMNRSFATPERIARKVFKLIEMRDPPLRMKVTLDAFLFAVLRRVVPASLFHRLMFKLLPQSKNWGKEKVFRRSF